MCALVRLQCAVCGMSPDRFDEWHVNRYSQVTFFSALFAAAGGITRFRLTQPSSSRCRNGWWARYRRLRLGRASVDLGAPTVAYFSDCRWRTPKADRRCRGFRVSHLCAWGLFPFLGAHIGSGLGYARPRHRGVFRLAIGAALILCAALWAANASYGTPSIDQPPSRRD